MTDILIIGAGAAGLEAARVFRSAGIRYLLLEARSTVGGRIRVKDTHPTMELGAEFLHGEARLTRRRFDEIGLEILELKPEFYVFEGERLRAASGYWKILARAFSHLRAHRHDRPFSEFVATADLTPSERLLSAAFVEGFDAAELERISANALVGTSRMAASPEARAIARPVGGYTPLVQAMAKDHLDSIRLRTVVREIEWKRGAVTVRVEGPGGEKLYSALAALVTVPIGVLKAPPGAPGAIRFSPAVPGLSRSLSRIEMGQVVRMTLEFSREIRALFFAKFRHGFPFVSSPGLDFMTWWGSDPDTTAESTLVTAWAGGTHAVRLAPRTRPERIALALENLARMTGLRPSTLARGLRGAYHHDWAEDPYARGAYSYPGLESEGIPGRLGRSAAKTLYFAGEALETEHVGTVEGALRSGRSQARKIVKVLGTRPFTAPILHADIDSSALR